MPGKASCTRISSARTPADSIKAKQVSEYHLPTSELLTVIR